MHRVMKFTYKNIVTLFKFIKLQNLKLEHATTKVQSLQQPKTNVHIDPAINNGPFIVLHSTKNMLTFFRFIQPKNLHRTHNDLQFTPVTSSAPDMLPNPVQAINDSHFILPAQCQSTKYDTPMLESIEWSKTYYF